MFSFPLNYYRGLGSRLGLKTRTLLLFLLLIQPYISIAQWVREKDALNRRTELMNISYQGKLYNFAGLGPWPVVNPSTEVYDPVQKQWTLLAPMPDGNAVTHQGLVLIDDKVWHIGGRLESTTGGLTSKVWIYDITNNKWLPGPDLKDPATGQPILWGGGGAALIGRKIHVVGGFIDNPCKNDQSSYHLTLNVDKWLADPANTIWENKLKPLPIKRNHISTTVLYGKMYVIGGQFGHDCNGGQDQKYSHVYNPLTDTWTQLTNLPMVRSHCEASIFPIDGYIYIASGDGGTNLVTRLDPKANHGLGAWDNLPEYTLPHHYIGAAAKVIDNRMYFSCGRLYNTRNIRAETFSAPFTRNIPYQLGFLTDCIDRTISSDRKATLTNLLYTIEGEKKYRLVSDASWLVISEMDTGVANQTGDYMQVKINTNGLVPGNYKARVTAKGIGSGKAYANASFCVNIKVTPNKNGYDLTLNKKGKGNILYSPKKTKYNKGDKVTVKAEAANGYRFTGWSDDLTGQDNPASIVINANSTITANFEAIEKPLSLVRINAGGSTQIVNDVTWQGCPTGSNCQNYVSGGVAVSKNKVRSIQGSQLNNLNQAIYKTEWTAKNPDPALKGTTAFSYNVPVTNGKYLIRLYFVELEKTAANLREFDIKLEDKPIFDNFDIYEAANGRFNAIVREVPATISDSMVNLNFIYKIDRPKINAIEIIPFKDDALNTSPVANAGPDQELTADVSGVAKVILNGSASTDKDGYLTGYHWIKNEQHLDNNITQAMNLEVGTHKVSLVVKDNAGAYHKAIISIKVKADTIQKNAVVTIKNPTNKPGIKAPNAAENQPIFLRVYPNPGTKGDQTLLEIGNGGIQETFYVTIYDLRGRSIVSTQLRTDALGHASTALQLADKVSPGTYLIRAYSTNRSGQTKLSIR